MRKATEVILKCCDQRGIKVLSFHTDGQWIKLMNRDSKDEPLTVLQLAKDIWKSVQRSSKKELIDKISEINRVQENHLNLLDIKTGRAGSIIVGLKSGSLLSIATPLEPKLWNKQTSPIETSDDPNGQPNLVTDWLPETVINQIPENEDPSLTHAIALVSNEVRNILPVSTIYQTTCDDIVDNLNILSCTNKETSWIDVTSSQTTSDVGFQCRVSLDSVENAALQTNKDITEFFSEEKVSKLTVRELDILYDNIKDDAPSQFQKYKKSWKRGQKISFLCGLLGFSDIPDDLLNRSSTRIKNPVSLRKSTIKVIQMKSYPKSVLCASYAAHMFPLERDNWQKRNPFPSPITIGGLDECIPYWYSYPERRENGQLLAKGTDCSHNLTHLRVRSCTTGIRDISKNAWKSCAKSNETMLSVPLVEDLIDKQSVPNARTNFSVEVETWMRHHGYEKAAEFTNIVRNWYAANDDPGIPALERVKNLILMRNFLLRGVNFSKFPPYGQYVEGIPVVTFEGMMIDIDTKLQLHKMTDSYNIRAVGSLPAETTVGFLQAMYPNPQVSIKARDVPNLVSSVVEVMTCKCNPNRGFKMRTSRYGGVYPDHDPEIAMEDAQAGITHAGDEQALLYPRDHAFDTMARKNQTRRKMKFGEISAPHAPSRGALPVRQYHRMDESKILPMRRLGIDISESDD